MRTGHGVARAHGYGGPLVRRRLRMAGFGVTLALVAGLLGYPFGALSPAGAATASLPGGAPLSVTVDGPDDEVIPPGEFSFARGTAAVGKGGGQGITLVYALDLSTNAQQPNGGGGFKCPAATPTVNCERTLLNELQQDAKTQDEGVAEVGAVGYARGATTTDVNPKRNITQIVTGPTTDLDRNDGLGGPDIENVMASIFTDRDIDTNNDGDVDTNVAGFDQFTREQLQEDQSDLADAIQSAVQVAVAGAQPTTYVALMSSGQVSDADNVSGALANVPPGVHFYVFAVGRNATCNDTLQEIARNTGGVCTTPQNPDDGGDLDSLEPLQSTLRNLKAGRLDSITVSMDGGAPVAPDIVTLGGNPVTLPQQGPVNVSWAASTKALSIGRHTICATATGSDFGGSGSVTECKTKVVDHPPTASAGGPYSGLQDNPIPIAGTDSDPDEGQALFPRWEVAAGPAVRPGATCTFADPQALSTTVSCTAPGEYALTLTVSDGFVQATAGTTLTVSNVPPVVSAGGPYTGTEGLPVSLTGTVTDPDSPGLTTSWSVTPPPGSDTGGTDGGTDGSADGSTAGGTDGSTAGGTDGSTDGGSDGATDGATDGGTTGGTDGTTAGGTDGSTDGGTEGTTDGGTGGGPQACTFTDPTALQTTITCPVVGTYTLTLTVNDGDNPPVAATTTLTIVPAHIPVGSLSLGVAVRPGIGFVGGDPVLVTYTVRNDGELPMPNVRLGTTPPAALAGSVPAPAVLVPAGGAACRIGTICQLGTLQPGQQRVVRFAVRAAGPVDARIAARLATDGKDANAGDNTASAHVVVRQPQLTVDPQVGHPGVVVRAVGQNFPAGARVRLTWSIGVSQALVAVVGRDGTFTAQVLVFNHDQVGGRFLDAAVVGGTRFGQVESNLVTITRRGLQPPFGDKTPWIP